MSTTVGFPIRSMNNLQNFLHQLYRGKSGLLLGLVGKKIFLDPANGSDSNSGLAPDEAVQTLTQAYALCTAGKNDTVVLIGDGSTTATARVDASFTWAKNATHLIGVCSPGLYSQRARIAPTSTTAAFTPYFTISANGCYFQDIQWFMGFTTGTTSQIGMIVSGSRNVFQNCHIAGMGDAASSADAGSRTLKLGGSGAGENYFNHCVIGVDTEDRSAANATIEFVGGATRNVFEDCIFPIRATAGTPLFVKGAAAACMDRFNEFIRCRFLNHNTTVTAIATLAASAGGFLLFKDCALVKITGFGSDATTRGQVYIEGGTPAAATTGLAVAPTA